jgi:hypothetical protein
MGYKSWTLHCPGNWTWNNPDATHGAGISTYIKNPKNDHPMQSTGLGSAWFLTSKINMSNHEKYDQQHVDY